MTVPVPEPFQDLDAVIALAIEREEERSPLRGVDAIAVAAIVATSHAGAELTKAAERAGIRGEHLRTEGRKYLDRARQLMSDFAATREIEQ